MITRHCIHCEAEVELLEDARTVCPVCGLDPDLPRIAFDDAPAFFLAGDPRREPVPVPMAVPAHTPAAPR